MPPIAVLAKLRTTDLSGSVSFYVERLCLALGLRHGDFYAGTRAGAQVFDRKRADRPDASVAASCLRQCVALERAPHDTAWGTRACVSRDSQGHIVYFGQYLPAGSSERK